MSAHEADLYKKQHLEFQRAEAAIRSIMPAAWGASVLQLLLGISNGLRSQPEHAQRLLDEHDPASVARPGRRPPAVCITLISALRECWPLQECGDGGTSSSRPDQVEGSC